jgi:hypothetical protein
MSNLTNIVAAALAAKHAANNPKVPTSTTSQVQQAKHGKQVAANPKEIHR